MRVMRLIGFIFFLLTVGCAKMQHASPESAAPTTKTAAVEPTATRPTTPSIAKSDSPSANIPAKPPVQPPTKKPSATPSSGNPASPSLDLTALKTRLKDTKAIGVFTKITLKNQVDDLLNQFRAYYEGQAKTTLGELRQPYERLLLKVLSLLQDGDPELARAIVASRETIWSILADPKKFATLST